MSIPQPNIKMATWNVFYDTKVEVLEPILKGLLKDDVVLLFMQEAQGVDIANMLKRNGLAFFQHGENVVAWDRDHFTEISRRVERLADAVYFREGGAKVVVDMPVVILCDKFGRTLTAGSYHTPSSVEKANPKDIPVNRLKVIREIPKTWARIATAAQTRATVLAGDDNLDESRLKSAFWAFWTKATTPLTEYQAPSPTHGNRRIDSFRATKGIKPVTAGSVRGGGGDHRIHVRLFRWV